VQAISRRPHGILLEVSMLTVIRTLSMLIIIAFALLGVSLLLILWNIRQHPLSVFHYLHPLRGPLF
jgi:hypothetical protein